MFVDGFEFVGEFVDVFVDGFVDGSLMFARVCSMQPP